jgi:malonyl-CoA decarboxylase
MVILATDASQEHPGRPRMLRSVRQRAAALARDGLNVRRLVGSCRKLLSERGEAAGASLAKVTVDLYDDLDRTEQARFFAALAAEFAPDPQRVLVAAQAYAALASAENLARLSAAAEPPRQELFRRLNRAPGGTATILRMRERLLQLTREQPELDAVDADLRHLLSSWFNPGFLQIVRVDWRTPAYLLEQIIAHEAVHEIQGWGDLRRRLDADGRCFAFFHPALPDEPLIFVEVALADRMAETVAPLLTAKAEASGSQRATTAVFYSISNCQPGLKGISLGNFLIKQVVDVLSRELPRLRLFCTLSPIPGFVAWLAPRLADPDAEPLLAPLTRAVAESLGPDLAGLARDSENAAARLAPLREPLVALCAEFLTRRGASAEVARDPVARFHLNNGARLERINWLADLSRKGLRESLGMMANYLYVPRQIAGNHEKFIGGEIVASHRVRALAPGRGRARPIPDSAR